MDLSAQSKCLIVDVPLTMINQMVSELESIRVLKLLKSFIYTFGFGSERY